MLFILVSLFVLMPQASRAAGFPALTPVTVRTAVNAAVDNRSALLVLLDHPNPQVQLNALRSLRYSVGQTEFARLKVLSVMEDPRRARDVRYQAIKTLAWVAGYPDVQSRLMFYADHPQTAPDFKALHMKALYTRAAGDPRVRLFLMNRMATERDPVALSGAIWALGEASHYPDTAAVLMRAARFAPTPALQDAAMRSLSQGTGRPEVRAFIDAVILGRVPVSLEARQSAVRLSGTIPGTQRALAVLAANPRAIDPRLSDAEAARLSAVATQALAGDPRETAVYFHRAFYGYDPLDGE